MQNWKTELQVNQDLIKFIFNKWNIWIWIYKYMNAHAFLYFAKVMLLAAVVDKLLSVFDHFVGLALKGITIRTRLMRKSISPGTEMMYLLWFSLILEKHSIVSSMTYWLLNCTFSDLIVTRGILVRALDSKFRSSRSKITESLQGWLNLSSVQGCSNEKPKILGTHWLKASFLRVVALRPWESWTLHIKRAITFLQLVLSVKTLEIINGVS